MSEAVPNGNGGWTQKEILARIDSKVDALTQTVAAKNAHYDVEIALLKARADKQDIEDKERDIELEETKVRQESILSRINVAAGAVGLILFLSPVIWILVNKLVGP